MQNINRFPTLRPSSGGGRALQSKVVPIIHGTTPPWNVADPGTGSTTDDWARISWRCHHTISPLNIIWQPTDGRCPIVNRRALDFSGWSSWAFVILHAQQIDPLVDSFPDYSRHESRKEAVEGDGVREPSSGKSLLIGLIPRRTITSRRESFTELLISRKLICSTSQPFIRLVHSLLKSLLSASPTLTTDDSWLCSLLFLIASL